MTVMPYNTRRKSVSLASLGIHIPNSSRSSSNRSPPNKTTTPNEGNTSSSEDAPPTKKLKRSSISSSASIHSPTASSPSSTRPRKTSLASHIKNERLSKPGGRIAETTPPPSPGDADDAFKIDTQGISDEIVVAVIQQLQKTGNRPHLLKELAAVLQYTVPIVETSANQPAIISSRLTNYMKRPWTALSPCPLGKELIGTHPKRIYFFLSGPPRQPFPEIPEINTQSRIISPSLTSNENEMDAQCDRRRSEMSPSPEVDLSACDSDNEDEYLSASDSFADLPMAPSNNSSTSSISQRRAVPPLEGDEEEFMQIINNLARRRERDAAAAANPPVHKEAGFADFAGASEFTFTSSDAASLFNAHLVAPPTNFYTLNSPMIQPQKSHFSPSKSSMTAITLDTIAPNTSIRWSELREVETVELDELDDLFASY